MHQKYHECCHRQTNAHLANQLGQAVQLDVQRSLHSRYLRRLACHVANLRLVANGRYHVESRTAHHHRRTQQHVLRVSFCHIIPLALWRGVRGEALLRRDRFACQARLVDLQIDGLQQPSVGRNLVARFYHDDISHHDVTTRNLHHFVITPLALRVPLALWRGVRGEAPYHLHWLFFAQLRQHVKLTRCVAFEIEAHRRRQHHSGNDAHRFQEVLLHEGQYQRHDSRNQQDAHHRVFIFLQIESPHRGSFRRCQHVLSVLLPTYQHFRSTQSLSFLIHNRLQRYD